MKLVYFAQKITFYIIIKILGEKLTLGKKRREWEEIQLGWKINTPGTSLILTNNNLKTFPNSFNLIF